MKKIIDNPAGVPAPPPGRYSHVARVEVADSVTLVLAGQCAVDDEMKVVAPGDVRAQSERIFEIIGTLLAAHGATFADVINVRTYLTDIGGDLAAYAEVRNRYLPVDALPTSTTVEVSKLFLPEAVIEVEITAVRALVDGE
ncbi:RidA family protein [Actinokineospora enzanensis]|uniref:RidA family protein n=1 Tax=Actinokineospora enzanensis TaxID=155975 RepID=UPI000374473B|nr:Rid family hydrolase [Actinokineospora enzanensis]